MNTHATYKGTLSLDEAAALRHNGDLAMARKLGYVPILAGGTSYSDAFPNPLDTPTMATTKLTVDVLLNSPTRITRTIADLVMKNFFLDQVFQVGGDVSGGAVLYDLVTMIEVYADRDVERVQPGSEFPLITGVRVPPLIAAVEKFGGKFVVTDEAKRRNDVSRITNQMRRLSNTITRKLHQRGIGLIEAAVTAYTRTQAATTTWKACVELEASKVKKLESPMRGIMLGLEKLEKEEMGYNYDTLVVHPAEAVYGRMFYNDDAGLKAALADVGITNLIVTPRAKEKAAWLLAGKQVGFMRLEEPMSTVTEREGFPEGRQQTWIQTSINPVFGVTDPSALLEVTGIG
jgi:hypothetical protein